jgi:hypothetical protein
MRSLLETESAESINRDGVLADGFLAAEGVVSGDTLLTVLKRGSRATDAREVLCWMPRQLIFQRLKIQ